MSSRKVIIRWPSSHRCSDEHKRLIREKFGIPKYETLNGWNPAEIKDEDWELFEETARRGFFYIMDKKWCKNGGQYIF